MIKNIHFNALRIHNSGRREKCNSSPHSNAAIQSSDENKKNNKLFLGLVLLMRGSSSHLDENEKLLIEMF